MKKKKKTKMMALLEIAIMLCSVFFVAIPAIAAGQTTQKAITTASEDDYVLGIYGNANEDDTIDMGDVVYTKLAIFGKKPKTELCDAKYDGRINVLDVIQTKLIILGKEKEITVIDGTDRTVTIKKPVERVIVLNHYAGKTIRALGAKDKIVGMWKVRQTSGFWPELKNKPVVSGPMARNPNYEAIINLEPDVLFSFAGYGDFEEVVAKLEPAGIPVVLLGWDHMETFAGDVRITGMILGKKEEAEEYLKFSQTMINLVEERTKELKPEEQKTVYYEFYRAHQTLGGGSRIDAVIQKAGGLNIFGELPPRSFNVDPEELLKRDPDMIFKDMHGTPGYDLTDISKLEEAREEMLSRPGWDRLTAVKNDDVYIGARETFVWAGGALGVGHMAKRMYPDLFEDFDFEAFLKEYIVEWQGVPYQGVYFYPELS